MTASKNIIHDHAGDYMANERTFLAWIRTSIAIMAFGFVVEKFSIFLKKIAFYVGGNSGITKNLQAELPTEVQLGYSSIFGICLVGLGGVMCLLAFIKFKKTERMITNGCYAPTALLDLMLVIFMVLIGLSLIIYLVHSVLR